MPMYVSAGKIKKLWRTDGEAVLHEIKNLWTDQGQVFSSGPTIEVHNVSLSGLSGNRILHPLVSLTVPPGETWRVVVEGTLPAADESDYPGPSSWPRIWVGEDRSDALPPNQKISFSSVVTHSQPIVALETWPSSRSVSFVGTVAITYPD